MTPDERDELEALAEQVNPPCGFVLTGYGPTDRPCLNDRHDPRSVHFCGGVLVVAP